LDYRDNLLQAIDLEKDIAATRCAGFAGIAPRLVMKS
jgi:hypothetical protein